MILFNNKWRWGRLKKSICAFSSNPKWLEGHMRPAVGMSGGDRSSDSSLLRAE